jgi:general secretion pathway protein H
MAPRVAMGATPTSATTSLVKRVPSVGRRLQADRRQSGFTLLELIIVVVIMAVSVAIAAPSVRSGWQQAAVRRSVRQFISATRAASSLAIRTRRPTSLAVVPADGTFGSSKSRKLMSLPDFAEFGEITGGRVDDFGDGGAERILFRFHPMGSADGGSVELRFRTSGGAQSYTLTINSLLGTIALRDNST